MIFLYSHDIITLCRYAPADIVTAIYSNVAGAQYSDSMAQWILPCDAEVDVSIMIQSEIIFSPLEYHD